MQIEEVRIDEISLNDRNPKIHTDKQIKLIEQSIKRFGYTNPVILSADNVVLAGHARVKACINAGNDTVPCIRTKLSGKDAEAYLLADNRLSDIAPYDRDILSELLSDLPKDLAEITGFDTVQIDALLAGEDIPDIDRFISDSQPEAEREEVDAEPQIDRAAELNEKWQVKTGDLWQCGDHRLICGDCTDPAVVERVMMGEKAELCFTSPPYASQRKYDETSGFVPIPSDRYVDWVEPIQENIFRHLLTEGSFFLNIKEAAENGIKQDYVKRLIIKFIDAWGWKWIEEYCWPRPALPLDPNKSRRFKNGWESVYHFSKIVGYNFFPDNVRHESDGCFSYKDQKAAGKQICDGGQGLGGGAMSPVDQYVGLAYPSNVLANMGGAKVVGHSAAFPVGLPTFFLNGFSELNGVVLDPFLGSGTTMIACENTGRKCRGVEISPDYVAVCLQRFKDATGKEPVKING